MKTSVLLESLDRRDGAALKQRSVLPARSDRLTIDQNRTRAALAFAAAVFGAREIEPIAKDGEQRIVGGNLGLTNCAVHPQCQMHAAILPGLERTSRLNAKAAKAAKKTSLPQRPPRRNLRAVSRSLKLRR